MRDHRHAMFEEVVALAAEHGVTLIAEEFFGLGGVAALLDALESLRAVIEADDKRGTAAKSAASLLIDDVLNDIMSSR